MDFGIDLLTLVLILARQLSMLGCLLSQWDSCFRFLHRLSEDYLLTPPQLGRHL